MQSKPNIVVIMLDDIQFDHWRSEDVVTPNIDQFVSESATFERFYTSPVCSPTRAMLLTGEDILSNGVPSIIFNDHDFGLDPSKTTYADALGGAGYQTWHVGKQHLGADPQYWFNNRGFDYTFTAGNEFGGAANSNYFNQNYYVNGQPIGRNADHKTDVLSEEAARLITQDGADQPFVLQYWLHAPHLPATPPRDIAARYGDGVDEGYLGLVEAADRAIGEVLDALDAAGVADDTIVMLFGDNGSPLPITPSNALPESDLRAFKYELFEGGVRQPLFVRWPAQEGLAGKSFDKPLYVTDIAPTLAELGGGSMAVDGVSFANVLAAPTAELEDRAPFVISRPPERLITGFDDEFTLIEPQYKLITRSDGSVQLFDIPNDPGETTNLANLPEHADRVAAMSETLLQQRLSGSEILDPINDERMSPNARALTVWITYEPGDLPSAGQTLTIGEKPGSWRIVLDSAGVAHLDIFSAKTGPGAIRLSATEANDPTVANDVVFRFVYTRWTQATLERIGDENNDAAFFYAGPSGGPLTLEAVDTQISTIDHSEAPATFVDGATVRAWQNNFAPEDIGAPTQAERPVDLSFTIGNRAARIESFASIDAALALAEAGQLLELRAGGTGEGETYLVADDDLTVAGLTAVSVQKQFVLAPDVDRFTLSGAVQANVDGNARANTLTLGDDGGAARGMNGDDVLIGGRGADVLSGLVGDDRLAGGRGDDFLYGGAGSDTYVYNPGDGADVFLDADSRQVGGIDKIVFGAGIAADDITISETNSRLVLTMSATDSVTIAPQSNVVGRIEQFEFADGEILTFAELETRASSGGNGGGDLSKIPEPPERNTDGFDRSEGDATNDVLSGSEGLDLLIGRQGDDILRGRDGGDVLEGGDGGDVLRGGAGDDIVLGQTGDDLVVSGDRGADFVNGGAGNDVVRGGAGDDTVVGDAGDDRVIGDRGDDRVYGGDGRDVLIGQDGADFLVGGAGDDILIGGNGADVFLMVPGDGRDVVRDFEDGSDLIDVSLFDIETPSDILGSIRPAALNGALVTLRGDDGATNTFVVRGVDAGALTEDDFIF